MPTIFRKSTDWVDVILNVIIVLLLAGVVCCIILMSSCNAPKRVAIAAARYPAAFARECASRYPVKDSTITNTVYREGAIRYLPGDTVQVDCDTVREFYKGGVVTRLVRVPCPPQGLRVDTVYKTTFKQVENTARVAAVTADFGECVQTAKRLQHLNSIYLLWALIATLLIVGTVVLRFLKPKLF